MGRITTAGLVVALAACGDNSSPSPSFELVGRSDLGARGMSSALAVAGDTVYIGSRNDKRGVAVVDITDPSAPQVLGEPIAPITGLSSRELRAVPDLDLLVVMNLQCTPDLHGCSGAAPQEFLAFYDIHDRHAPVLLSMYPIATGTFMPRSPHEMYLQREGARVRVFVTTPPASPSLEIIDATDPRVPVRVAAWDPRQAGLSTHAGGDDILHSVSLSADGTVAYLSHQQSGLLLANISALPAITLITPPAAAVHWDPITSMGPHSTVEVPGRDLVVVTEEIYPQPFGGGCPWGPLRMVDTTNPAAPLVVGVLRLPENEGSYCSTPHERVAFTAHNATVTHDLALVTWYAGGLQAVDISDPTRPTAIAELRPEPLTTVAVEDPGLGGAPVEMWSYPVIQNGLVYVVDVRNGLYVLRYHGPWSDEVVAESFLEGNSNL
ncbi:hypothetical protein BH11MYX3_BH11MYX3_01390 [soil metagenome]